MNSKQIVSRKHLRSERQTERARPRPLCVYLEAEVLFKEYLSAIHCSFVISNNILAHSLEFRSIFKLTFLRLEARILKTLKLELFMRAEPPPPAGVRGRQPPKAKIGNFI